MQRDDKTKLKFLFSIEIDQLERIVQRNDETKLKFLFLIEKNRLVGKNNDTNNKLMFLFFVLKYCRRKRKINRRLIRRSLYNVMIKRDYKVSIFHRNNN